MAAVSTARPILNRHPTQQPIYRSVLSLFWAFLAVYFSAFFDRAKPDPDQENNYNYYWPNLVFKKQTELWLQLLVLMSLLNLE